MNELRTWLAGNCPRWLAGLLLFGLLMLAGVACMSVPVAVIGLAGVIGIAVVMLESEE